MQLSSLDLVLDYTQVCRNSCAGHQAVLTVFIKVFVSGCGEKEGLIKTFHLLPELKPRDNYS